MESCPSLALEHESNRRLLPKTFSDRIPPFASGEEEKKGSIKNIQRSTIKKGKEAGVRAKGQSPSGAPKTAQMRDCRCPNAVILSVILAQ